MEPTPIFRETKAARLEAWMFEHRWDIDADPTDAALSEFLRWHNDLDKATVIPRQEIGRFFKDSDVTIKTYGNFGYLYSRATPPASIVKGLSI